MINDLASREPSSLTRRRFLQRAGALAVVAPALGGLVAACSQPAAPSAPGAGASTGAAAAPTANQAPASGARPVSISLGINAFDKRTDVTKQMIAAFQQKYPNITVQMEGTPFAQYFDKLNALLVSKQVYDVFWMSGANFQAMAPKGVFEDLTPYIKQSGLKLEDYVNEPDSSIWQDKVYGLPFEIDIQALFYNKKLFDAATIKYPDDTWTWDTFHDAALKLTKRDGDQTSQWGYFARNLYPDWTSFIAQNGGTILSDDRKTATLDQPAAYQAVQFMVDLIHKDKVSPGPGEAQSMASPFQTGKVAMLQDGSYSVLSYLDIKDFDWGVAVLPQGKKRATAFWTETYCMYSGSPNKDAAWTFLQWMLSPEGERFTAETKIDAPARLSVASGAPYTSAPPTGMEAFAKGFDTRTGIYYTPQWQQIMAGGTGAIQKELSLAWLGQKSAQDACIAAKQQVDQIIGKGTA